MAHGVVNKLKIIQVYIEQGEFVVYAALDVFHHPVQFGLDNGKLADLLADSRSIDMEDVDSIRDIEFIFGQHIPFRHTGERIMFGHGSEVVHQCHALADVFYDGDKQLPTFHPQVTDVN